MHDIFRADLTADFMNPVELDLRYDHYIERAYVFFLLQFIFFSIWSYSEVVNATLQAIDTVVAGILHDIVDDTYESLDSIEREFDADVAKLVAGVSRLSYINQVSSRGDLHNIAGVASL